MSYDKPTKGWKGADIDAMLAMLPVVEAEGFVAATWPETEVEIVDGVRHMAMPYPDYHPVVDTLWDLCYRTSAYLDPYAALPEDPTPDGVPFSVLGASFPPEYFRTATLDGIRRYLVLCTRGERFCDGHIASQFESGAILAALRRLRELRGVVPVTESQSGTQGEECSR